MPCIVFIDNGGPDRDHCPVGVFPDRASAISAAMEVVGPEYLARFRNRGYRPEQRDTAWHEAASGHLFCDVPEGRIGTRKETSGPQWLSGLRENREPLDDILRAEGAF